jgi:hypothetical protein
MAAGGRSQGRAFEESPDSTRQRCRVTPGGGNPRESATENETAGPPGQARVKRWGKSPPRTGQPGRQGKPHREQCRIGTSRRETGRAASARKSGLAAPGRGRPRSQRNGHPGATPTESGLQAIRAQPSPWGRIVFIDKSREGRIVVSAAGRLRSRIARRMRGGRNGRRAGSGPESVRALGWGDGAAPRRRAGDGSNAAPAPGCDGGP